MFDRNNFKDFVISQERLVKEKCSVEHPEIQYHGIYKDIIWTKSFRSVQKEEFSKLRLIGNLRDPKISRLHYFTFSDYKGEYWTENFKIATNFYPYHSSDIYQCPYCNRLFVVYIETSGHFPQQRIRHIKSELIVEEPGSCILELSDNKLKQLAAYLNLNKDQFSNLLCINKDIERVKTNFTSEDIIVSHRYDDQYLIVCKNELIYEILDLFE